MEEEIRAEILRGNERVKALSAVMCNLGTALFAFGVATAWMDVSDPWSALYIVVAIALTWAGIGALKALVPEN
jgi:hypothetical protein